MSIKTLRNIDELHAECMVRGISVDPFWSKTDYVNALRDYYLKERYGDDVPRALQLILQMDSPMLCKKFDSVPEKVRKDLMRDRFNYVEEKIDGCRMLMCFTRGKLGNINFDAFSRNTSVMDFLPINYGNKIILHKANPFTTPDLPEIIIDCEIVCPDVGVQLQKKSATTQTQLQSTAAILATDAPIARQAQKDHPFVFKCFDVVYHENYGGWVIDKTLEVRKDILKDALVALEDQGFTQFEEVRTFTRLDEDGKMEVFNRIVREGGEGVVIKNWHSTYSTKGNRTNDWVKMKRTMHAAIGDTIDGFISGFHLGKECKEREGQVASLDISAYDETGKARVIATVANLTEQERNDMTVMEYDDCHKPTGYLTLNPAYYGKVVEIDGQDVSSVNHRLMHAKIIRWRPDKQAKDCVLSEADLVKYIL